jgi:hypothetical protein
MNEFRFLKGIPEVTMTGIKTDLNVTLTLIGNNMYRASYTPDTVGVYLLNVMWAERYYTRLLYFFIVQRV